MTLDLVKYQYQGKHIQGLVCYPDIERKRNSDINQGSLLCYKKTGNNPYIIMSI